MLRERETEYAEAAQTVGNPTWRIIFVHLFPNSLPPLIVQATLAMGFALLTLAALSFIGLGIQPPNCEWGEMISEGANLIVTGQWWLSLFPSDRHPRDGADLQPRSATGCAISCDPTACAANEPRPRCARKLVVHFETDGGLIEVLDDVNFTMQRGNSWACRRIRARASR